MRIDIFTLFPGMFHGPFNESMLKRAREHNIVEIFTHDIREHASDLHRMADDTPYGGGGGMIMKPEPVFSAVESVLAEALGHMPVVLLTPQGRLFDHSEAARLATNERLALICGHYEGVDERIRLHLATDEISIGDYVLTGGEIPAMVLVDAVVRLIPGVLGDPMASNEDSHATGMLEHPHYTRPYDFRGWKVPDVLLSGNHGAVADWRHQQSLIRTLERRPELLDSHRLSASDQEFLRTIAKDISTC